MPPWIVPFLWPTCFLETGKAFKHGQAEAGAVPLLDWFLQLRIWRYSVSEVYDWSMDYVFKVHWNVWCHYLEFTASAQKIIFPFLSIAILEPPKLFYTLKHCKFEKLHLRRHVIHFCLQNPSKSGDLEEEEAIWVHMGQKAPLPVTWFQAKVSEKTKQSHLAFQLLLLGTHFIKWIWQLFIILKTSKISQSQNIRELSAQLYASPGFRFLSLHSAGHSENDEKVPLWLQLSRLFCIYFTEE